MTGHPAAHEFRQALPERLWRAGRAIIMA